MRIDIDVRREEEWNEGHKPEALHFELSRIENGEVPPVPKDSDIHVYCRSGGRAGRAKELLLKLGFENVVNDGGFE